MILCCGEALIDMIPAPAGDSIGFVPHVGGAVFNTAIALGRLGVEVGMISGLSRDLFGQQLTEALSASMVGTQGLILSDRPTTLAFVRIEDGQASYTFYDENSAGRMLEPADFPAEIEAEALYFGGISLACEPGAEAYRAFMAAQRQGRAVMIDPNVRAGFVPDRARYTARIAAMMAQADIVKLSDEDLFWLMPGTEPVAEKAAQIRASGAGIVIVTKGRDGAVAWLPDGTEVSVAAEDAVVVDTVGAGDTFNAGVLASLQGQGMLTGARVRHVTADQLRVALEHGARVAAVTVSRAGANPPWLSELG
ncbi:carbohydrate kinase family protein [Pseudooceanicola sp. C21-150M6]|uniref:carbohydrate kinase family protein n=1 Tax=Pseudooceanicola sp. C21-150M6 TaxID=3434355 RepID=UPI003D7F828A